MTTGRIFNTKLSRSVLLVLGCLISSPGRPADQADFILVVDANIITMNPELPRARAMALQGNRIVAVGDEAMVRGSIDGAYRTFSLSGRTLVPGFIETHDHLILGSISHGITNVDPFAVPRLESAIEVLANTAPGEDGWIVAFGADQTLYEERRGPMRSDLDAIHPDVPVVVFHLSGHAGFVNSEALRRSGIDRDTPDPDGGYFEKDEDGELTGYLSGQPALFRVAAGYPPPTRESVLAAARARAGVGVTTASEIGFMDPFLLELGRSVTSRDDFPIRVMGALTVNTPGFADLAKNLPAYETPKLTFRFAKTWTDGSPQGGTAFFSQGYYDPEFGGAGAQASQDRFNEILAQFYELDLWPAVHANGDAAVDVALNAIEFAQQKHGRKNIRPHLVHAQYTRPEQIERMAKLGVSASFFPTHIYYWGDLHYARTLGPERAQRLSAMADAFAAGLSPTMHNDPPVTPVDPILNMWIAVNRETSSGRVLGKDQTVTPEQALAAYTINAAYQFGIEQQVGSLEAGKLADFVVLDADPLEIDPGNIRDIKIIATVVGGEVVYARPKTYDRVNPPD